MTGLKPEAGIAKDVTIDVTAITSEQAEIIAVHYGLGIIGNTIQGELDDLTLDKANIDVGFVAEHPNLPAENVTNWLDNYTPRTSSQVAMLEAATRLVGYRSLKRMAGLIVCGNPGTGKTHIAVGVAKAAMLSGQRARFMNAPTAKQNDFSTGEAVKAVDQSDIAVVDDLTDVGFPRGPYLLSVISEMHNKGAGKLLVTSNYESPDALILDLLSSTYVTGPNRVRLADRIGSSLLGLTVEGISFRNSSQEDQAPWWQE